MKPAFRSMPILLFVAASLLCATRSWAQPEGKTTTSNPWLYTSIAGSYGKPSFVNADLFLTELGTKGNALFKLPFLHFLYLGLSAGWRQPTIAGDTGLSLGLLYGGASVAAKWAVGRRLVLGSAFDVGYFQARLTDGERGVDPRLSATASLAFYFTHTFGLAFSGGLESFSGLFSAWFVSFGPALRLFAAPQAPKSTKTVVNPSSKSKPAVPTKPSPSTEKPVPAPLKATSPPVPTITPVAPLAIVKVDLQPIFPVFYKYFDDHPLGSVTVKNNTADPVTVRSVDFYIKQYMDYPKTCATDQPIAPHGETTIDLYALFTNQVLGISEGTKVSADLNVKYLYEGQEKSLQRIDTVRIYDRNALTWDDDRRAAAFVAAKDPSVMKFAKNVMGMVKESANRAVNHNLLKAMALHDALGLFDLTYVVDPSTPYEEMSKKKLAVDYLQFPSQTLDFKAGDCDDLSILYSSLLESVGVETAFITIPGHIFIAFSIDTSPDRARKDYLHPDDLIFMKDQSWVPVEVTSVGGSFLEAWQTGAKEWRENSARRQANFYPIHDAWKLYEPVGFTGSTVAMSLPAKTCVVDLYHKEVADFVDGEIYPQIAQIQGQIQNHPGDLRYVNKLGVLYGRYGLDDRARHEFSAILAKKDYFPALINMGNLSFLEKDMQKALDFYTRAQKLEPKNPSALLAVARVNHELENYGTTKAAFDQLKKLRPDLAARFAYLDLRGSEAARAEEISQTMDVVLWSEEDGE